MACSEGDLYLLEGKGNEVDRVTGEYIVNHLGYTLKELGEHLMKDGSIFRGFADLAHSMKDKCADAVDRAYNELNPVVHKAVYAATGQEVKDIPFFGSAEADLIAITGVLIGSSIGFYKGMKKLGGGKLFPDYSNLCRI